MKKIKYKNKSIIETIFSGTNAQDWYKVQMQGTKK